MKLIVSVGIFLFPNSTLNPELYVVNDLEPYNGKILSNTDYLASNTHLHFISTYDVHGEL